MFCGFSDYKHSLSSSEKYRTKKAIRYLPETGLHMEDLQPQKYLNIPLHHPKDNLKTIKSSEK